MSKSDSMTAPQQGHTFNDVAIAQAVELDRLRIVNAELQRDADRYRWLRAEHYWPDDKHPELLQGIVVTRYRTNEFSEPDQEDLEGEYLDAAIDAALAKAQGAAE